MKIGGRLARNACFDAPACLVSSLWFSCGLAVSMGEAAKPILFRRFPSRLSCRFAWQAWHCDIPTCLIDNVSKVVLCGRRNIFASFSQDELQFLWQAQHFGDLHHHFAWQAQPHCVLYTSHSTLRTLHFTLHTLHFTLHTLHLHTILETLKVQREPYV